MYQCVFLYFLSFLNLVNSHFFKDSFISVFIDYAAAAPAAKSLQSCPTLCNPIDGSPPGSPIPGILQAKHWGGLSFPSPMRESEK